MSPFRTLIFLLAAALCASASTLAGPDLNFTAIQSGNIFTWTSAYGPFTWSDPFNTVAYNELDMLWQGSGIELGLDSWDVEAGGSIQVEAVATAADGSPLADLTVTQDAPIAAASFDQAYSDVFVQDFIYLSLNVPESTATLASFHTTFLTDEEAPEPATDFAFGLVIIFAWRGRKCHVHR